MPSTKYTTIHVTAQDIEHALRRKSSRCVVAVAVARSIPDARAISVDLQTIRWTGPDGERLAYLTPPAAAQYVIDFDAGRDIEPFSFRVSDDHRIPIARQKQTPQAKEAQQARDKVRNERRKVERAAARVEAADQESDASPAERTAAAAEHERAQEVLAEAIAHGDAIRTAYRGQMGSTRVTEGRPKVPNAFARGTRHYGHRSLRINQDAEAAGLLPPRP